MATDDSSKQDQESGDEATEKVSQESPDGGQSPAIKRGFFRVTIPVVACILVGMALGGGVFTFDYAKGTSYLSSESQTCANCHIMQDHFDAWNKSTHHHVARCNDCHAPHDFVGKWFCKGRNGFFHSLAFTTQDFHEPIMINDYNRKVVEDNCRHCHADFTHSIDVGVTSQDIEPLACIRCHQDVGHPN
ncbi:MAG: cytochrome c nitrite reductase small subunit [Mariniblastus sp.]|jgi:cytochrome c nitrite reductase small subunit